MTHVLFNWFGDLFSLAYVYLSSPSKSRTPAKIFFLSVCVFLFGFLFLFFNMHTCLFIPSSLQNAEGKKTKTRCRVFIITKAEVIVHCAHLAFASNESRCFQNL